MDTEDDPAPHADTRGNSRKRVALAFGGGGACGLAHIGALGVLEEEGIVPDCIVGSSMGGLIGALSAAGLRAREIQELAGRFSFPAWFMLGGVLDWDSIFRPAAQALRDRTFEDLQTPLLLTATDLEVGTQIVLRFGPLLPALHATCAVPGVLPPVCIDGRWLVDGGLVNQLPVDVAWMGHPDIVIAVNPAATTPREVSALHWSLTPLLMQLGKFVPNPATAKVCFEILTRAAEITVGRQAQLAAAMTGPEILIEPQLGTIGIFNFERLDEALEAGRRAMTNALPALRRLLDEPNDSLAEAPAHAECRIDPVCGMVISATRARATSSYAGEDYHFCSQNCRDAFDRSPDRYLASAPFSKSRESSRRSAGDARQPHSTGS